jgi:hypothetical protein
MNVNPFKAKNMKLAYLEKKKHLISMTLHYIRL